MKAAAQLAPSGSPQRVRLFQQRLLNWYDRNRRDLPWRRDPNPYQVWLSEIMLQQTRVGAVREHYRRFLKRFPTVERLAAARQASVLAAWSGLGYYRRARMLHAAARVMVKHFGGRLPETAEGLRALPGVGRYTAAAIASIAFGEAVAVVDGNVERVLERVQGNKLRKPQTWDAAETLLDRRRPGDFNQALMELGATVCRPRSPLCLSCPLFDLCSTRGVLEKSTSRTRQARREIHYALARQNGSIFLVRRGKDVSLMPGMWELPVLDAEDAVAPCLSLRHSITVTDYLVQVSQCSAPVGADGRWVKKAHVPTLPLTGLARKILRAAAII